MIIDNYSNINQIIAENSYSSVFLLLDTNTDDHCLDLFIKKSNIKDFKKVVVKDGEESKSIDTCEYVWEYLNSNNGDRKSLLINIRGGVVTDLGGNMSLDVPSSMPDDLAEHLGRKIGVIDRLITTRGEEIDGLLHKSIEIENKLESSEFKSKILERVAEFQKLNKSYKH